MNKSYFISVIVPAYNEEKYIAACLESIAAQTYPKEDFELIVELSGGNDRTKEIAETFGAKITNTGAKKGVSAARQNGAEAATGEIIAQTDADSQVSPDWLEKINQYFQDPEVVGVTGPVEFSNTNWFYKLSAKIFYPTYLRIMFFFGKKVFTGMNFAIKKETFEKIGGFDTSLLSAEDVDLGIRAGKVGKIVYASDLLVYTSARRVEKSPLGFLAHHVINSFYYLVLHKSRGFENIR